MKLKKYLQNLILLFVGIFGQMPSLVLAQSDTLGRRLTGGTEQLVNDLSTAGSGTGALQNIVSAIYQYGLAISSSVAIILFIVAGFTMITSQGNPDKLKEAKEIIVNTILGYAVVVLAIGILVLIKNTLGINF